MEPVTMNGNFKAWMDRLRDPSANRHSGALRDPETEAFCCLGHACDVAAKAEMPIGRWNDFNNRFIPKDKLEDSDNSYPPMQVAKWLGIDQHPALLLRDSGTWDVKIPRTLVRNNPDLTNDKALIVSKIGIAGKSYILASSLNDRHVPQPIIADLIEQVLTQ